MAGALGVRLGGRNVYFGRVEDRPRLGDGPAASGRDIERAARLSTVVGAARPRPVRRPHAWPARCAGRIAARAPDDRPARRRHPLGRRQERADRRHLPVAAPARREGRAVQGAEHVEQLGHRASTAAGRGGEIGRAQAMQAAACGLAPDVRFNPVLLKPGSDLSSQVVVRGQAVGTVTAANFVSLPAAALDRGVRGAGRAAPRVRGGDLRGGRQPGRDQPARRRLRQHGPGPGGRPAGDRRRRHRPRRRLRVPVRHGRAARPRRTRRTWPGSSSTGSAATRRCSRPGLDTLRELTGRPDLRGAPVRPRPVARRRGLARVRPAAGPARPAAGRAVAAGRGRPAAPHLQRDRRRGARHRAGRTGPADGRAGRAGRGGPHRAARHQVHCG